MIVQIKEDSENLFFRMIRTKFVFWPKPADVPVYVEYGAADIGIVGKTL